MNARPLLCSTRQLHKREPLDGSKVRLSKRLSALLGFATVGSILLALVFGFVGCSGGHGRPDGGDADGLEEFNAGDQAAESDLGDNDGADEDLGPIVLAVEKVLPSRGPVAGGTWANIIGSGFVRGIAESPFDVRDVTDVAFGNNPAIDIEVVRDDMISVRTPPGLPGPVTVTVKNPNGEGSRAGIFSYFDTVSVEKVDPRDLRCGGGTPLRITGTGFSSDTAILVGGRPASAVTIEGSTSARVLTPPGSPGPADVEVVNRNGSALLFRAVRYHPRPRITAVDPGAGSYAGGSPAAVLGSGFEQGASVLFGTTAVENPVFPALERIEVTTPPGLPGPTDITVVGPADTARLLGGYIYLNDPSGSLVITGVAPSAGPFAGGQTVTLAGEGFAAGVVEVLFDTHPAGAVQVSDDRRLTVTVPAGSAGPVPVSVKTGIAEATLADAYRYFVPLEINSIEPSTGPVAGGTPFNVVGSGFHAGIDVLFGGVPATEIDLVSENKVHGAVPPGSPGPIDLVLQDPDSSATLPNGFTYVSDLSLWRVDPDSGAVAGGTYTLCYGAGFGPGARIWFGAAEGTVVQVLSSSVLAARTPRGDAGEVPVAVESGASRFELPAGFSYFDPTNDRGGASGGPIRGSLNITVIDGTYTKFGSPLPGATVIIEDPPLSSTTDDRGQVTFSGPAMVRAVTITIGKPAFEAVTVSNLNAANLTIYLFPNEQEPIEIQPGGEVKVGKISGRVFGFKDIPGLPSGPTIKLQAIVLFTSWSIYGLPPFAGVPRGQPIEADGGSFEFETPFGTYSLYALFGAFDSATSVFTPALLGLRRDISVKSESGVPGQDIVLSTYLDQSITVHLENPPYAPGGKQATYGAYVSLDLGRDGVIFLSQATGSGSELVLTGLPSAASNSFLFVGHAAVDGSYPSSFTFRRQEGGLANGIKIGPFLGFTEILAPSTGTELTGGKIVWSSPQEPPPALTTIRIQTSEISPKTLWEVILPGNATEITLPGELLPLLPPGEPLTLLMYTAESPRFDFDRFSYSQLSSGRWTNYTVNFTALVAP